MKGQTHQQVAARDRSIVEARRNGASAVKLALQHGLSVQMIYQIAKKVPKPIRATSERDLKMASMYRQGLTLAVIGEKFGVTRERVRQIVEKQGLTRRDGGVSGTHLQKLERASAEAEARYQIKYGFSRAEMADFRKRRLTHMFAQQRRNASERGIVFRLSFKQWVGIWETSGKLELRGRGIGKYVMSRIKAEGCYELGNVHIQLATENSSEAVKKWQAEGKKNTNVGIYKLTPGTPTPWHAKVNSKEIGRFATESEAVQARATYIAENNITNCRGLGKGRGYTVTKRGYFYMQAGDRKRTFKTAEEARAAYLEACAEILAERASAGA
jgi:hypothetical protein